MNSDRMRQGLEGAEERLKILSEHDARGAVDVGRRNRRRGRAARRSGQGGARGEGGSADPVQAIADELRAYSGYDTLVMSTLPPGISRWLKLDLVHRAGRKFGLPVIHVAAEAPAPATPRWGRMFDDWAAAWSHHDVEKLVSLCTDDCVYEDVTMGAVNRGKAEMKSFANAVFAAFPDFKIQLMSGFTAGNWAGAEWTMSGTHKGDLPGIPATGKSFAVRGSTICELTAGKITRNSDYWDMGAFLKQTGLITGNVPPTKQSGFVHQPRPNQSQTTLADRW